MLRILRLWRLSRTDLRLLWFALGHGRRPIWLWPAVLILAWFALEPFNFAFPILGVLDDVILLPLVLHVLVKFLPNDIHSAFLANRGRHSSADRFRY
jgi:uncharacterized membrane protein YkvA (DUF1232 family)